MTLSLELPAEIEAALNEQAARRGVSAKELALEAVCEKARADEKRAERTRIWTELQGSMPHLTPVDEFLAEKHAETEREEAKWEARHGSGL